MADWQAIKTEYITTDTSYRKLAQKYDVHHAVIGQRAKAEKWVELRRQHIDKTQTKALNTISNKQAERAAKLIGVSDLLLDKVKGLLEADKDIQMIRSEADLREQEARIEKLRREAEPDKGVETPKLVVEGLPEEFKV